MQYAQAAPAAQAIGKPATGAASDSCQPTGFAASFDAAASAVARGACRVGGACAAISGGGAAVSGVLHAAVFTPVVGTGTAGCAVLAGVIVVAVGLGCAG